MQDSSERPSARGQNGLNRLAVWARWVEDGFLVTLFLMMLGVAVYQVVARELFNTGTLWGADFVGVSVLWVTMSGASIAARTSRHIRIDALIRFLSPSAAALVLRIVGLVTALVCLLLAWQAVQFIQEEFEYQTIGIGVVPAWVLQLIIPVGAGIMAVRYLLHTFWPPEHDSS